MPSNMVPIQPQKKIRRFSLNGPTDASLQKALLEPLRTKKAKKRNSISVSEIEAHVSGRRSMSELTNVTVRDVRNMLAKMKRESMDAQKEKELENKMAEKSKRHTQNMKKDTLQGWLKVITLYSRLRVLSSALKAGRVKNSMQHAAAMVLQRQWKLWYPVQLVQRLMDFNAKLKPIAWKFSINFRAKRRAACAVRCRDFFRKFGPGQADLTFKRAANMYRAKVVQVQRWVRAYQLSTRQRLLCMHKVWDRLGSAHLEHLEEVDHAQRDKVKSLRDRQNDRRSSTSVMQTQAWMDPISAGGNVKGKLVPLPPAARRRRHGSTSTPSALTGSQSAREGGSRRPSLTLVKPQPPPQMRKRRSSVTRLEPTPPTALRARTPSTSVGVPGRRKSLVGAPPALEADIEMLDTIEDPVMKAQVRESELQKKYSSFTSFLNETDMVLAKHEEHFSRPAIQDLKQKAFKRRQSNILQAGKTDRDSELTQLLRRQRKEHVRGHLPGYREAVYQYDSAHVRLNIDSMMQERGLDQEKAKNLGMNKKMDSNHHLYVHADTLAPRWPRLLCYTAMLRDLEFVQMVKRRVEKEHHKRKLQRQFKGAAHVAALSTPFKMPIDPKQKKG